MATIKFKSKPVPITTPQGDYMAVRVPTIKRHHCDMAAFRKHPKYGSYANSDLFPAMLKRVAEDRLGNYVPVDNPPPDVHVDTTGYLAVVTLDV